MVKELGRFDRCFGGDLFIYLFIYLSILIDLMIGYCCLCRLNHVEC